MPLHVVLPQLHFHLSLSSYEFAVFCKNNITMLLINQVHHNCDLVKYQNCNKKALDTDTYITNTNTYITQ